jgi:polyribonucleotide nucleotidyltransferase
LKTYALYFFNEVRYNNRKEMDNALMAPRKNKRSEASRAIAKAILEQYQPTSAEEMQDALRDIFGSMFEAMLQGEMDSHLGFLPRITKRSQRS